MVKARMRKKVAAANQAATEMDGEDDPGSKEEADAELDATMSSLAGHQKRKVTKRAKFLEKIRVATANKMKKSGKKKGVSAAFSDFATLESTLGEIARKGMSPGRKDKPVVLRAKARTKLAATESRRMQQVLAHPTFQTNPIAAISNHIAASLKAKPPETKKLAPSLEAKAEALAGRKKGKEAAEDAHAGRGRRERRGGHRDPGACERCGGSGDQFQRRGCSPRGAQVSPKEGSGWEER
jgi:hypothetical protein